MIPDQEEIINAQIEYTKMLGEELESMVTLAFVHGWRSQNVERSQELRKKLRDLFEQSMMPIPTIYQEQS